MSDQNVVTTTTEAIVTLDQQTNKDLRYLAVLKGKDEMTLLNELVQRAVKDGCYRHRRNRLAWQQKKALAVRQEELIRLAKEAGIDTSAFE